MVLEKQFTSILEDLIHDRRDDVAWQELADLVWPRVVAACSHFNLTQPSTVVHEELLTRLYRYTDFSAFPHGAGFSSYVWAVLKSIQSVKPKGKMTETLENGQGSPSTALSPDEDLVLDELLKIVSVKLSSKDRELVSVLINCKLTRKELAEQMGKTHNALSAEICRLRIEICRIFESEQQKK